MKPARRRILFRIAAVALGLFLLGLMEAGLRLAGLGRPADVGDPFVGFSEVRPLFVLNKSGDRYEVPLSRQEFFRPESFAAAKGADEFRIFCLGGSTVQGRPYSIETSFTTWLELSLQAADPSRTWEVINCGGVSYASYRLVPILQEVLTYEPDLILVYTGHNEFLEDRSYGDIRDTPEWLQSLHESASELRLYGVLRQITLELTPAPPDEPEELAAEVDALLDHQGALREYERDDAWQRGVVAHYEHNLRRMVHLAREVAVPLFLMNPVANLRDSAPFKSQHRADLTPEEKERFDRLWESAVNTEWRELTGRTDLIDELLRLDDRFAAGHFLSGRAYEAANRYDEAHAAYQRACDEDIVPLRMLESMHAALERVASQTRTPLLDVRALFEANATHGIPGDDQLIDHVHPRIEWHQKIAELLMASLDDARIVQCVAGWEERRKELYDHHWTTLDDSYFPRSLDRLEGLQRWATGRAGIFESVNESDE